MNKILLISIILINITSSYSQCCFFFNESNTIALSKEDSTPYTGNCETKYKNGKIRWYYTLEKGLFKEIQQWNKDGAIDYIQVYNKGELAKYFKYEYYKEGALKCINKYSYVSFIAGKKALEPSDLSLCYTKNNVLDYKGYWAKGQIGLYYRGNNCFYFGDDMLAYSLIDNNLFSGDCSYSSNELDYYILVEKGLMKKYVCKNRYGNIKDSLSFIGGNQKFIHYQFHANGNPKSVCTLNVLSVDKQLPNNIILDGKLLIYNKNGVLDFECNYMNGELHGDYLDYSDDVIFEQRRYVDGVLTNPSYKYDAYMQNKYVVTYDTVNVIYSPKVLSKELLSE